MSSSVVRPWLNVARCSSRRTTSSSARTLSTTSAQRDPPQEGRVLRNTDDWLAFRNEREEKKRLMDIFSRYGSTTNSDNTFKLRDGLHKPQAHATTSALLAAGAHFGHASTRMNPNFVPYAYGTRAGITIIDLDHTLPLLRRAANLTRAVARAGGLVVFIGTRPDLRPVVHKASERMGTQGFHVADRWLPGTLTNKRNYYPEEFKTLRMIPDLVVLLNPIQNTIAINECAAEHIPTIGIIDSNVDPRLVMYPIPANDENTRTAELIAGVLSIAGREGVALRKQDIAAQAKSRQTKDRIRKIGRSREPDV